MNRIFLRTLFFIIALASLTVNAAQNTPLRGAVCLVGDEQGRVLMVKDYLSGRYALPGGGIDDGESPENAALRELFEETGLRAEVIRRIDDGGSAAIYNCKTLSAVPTYEMENKGYVASWFSPHFGREIKTVNWLDTSTMGASEFRFPDQVADFPKWLKKSENSELNISSDFSDMASPFLAEHADINRSLQQAITALPAPLFVFIDAFIHAASGLGSTYLYVLLVPLALLTGGVKRLVWLAMMAVLTILSVYGSKLFFGIPRPFYIYPELGLATANGFSFPSGHTANAFAIWLTMASWFGTGNTKGKWILGLALGAALLTALSRIYLGVHYLMDVTAGAVLGTMIFLVSRTMSNVSIERVGSVFNPLTWLVMLLVLLPIAISQLQPMFALASSVCIGMGLVMAASKQTLRDVVFGRPPALFVSATCLSLSAIIAAVSFWYTKTNGNSIENLSILVFATIIGGFIMVYPSVRFAPRLSMIGSGSKA
ncbi:hypothetical protein CS022_19890 [Veronia nyctiphanis]|uniref:undecaprenyl-diphosphate phosphatase n=1 Tax=Veronia nyctiphanis TaxID=1278244 RepID=A0A4Q0YMQ4_9GAMM|nr:hypothetical protein CS022_19890 [Veronia nyctiphanis]